uniref:NADH-ubiquinone oxidoreductase chain 5 n=1 Tax=Teredorus hainanensis TaxID=2936564 RepID=A0A8T9VQ88_9ORTH|nr:NADH dehydrogenase subunit 5 [Teredorus hainanensis]UPH84298.1 NADH dehydrogenase subunit 5 [Teredorus hainanensis]
MLNNFYLYSLLLFTSSLISLFWGLIFLFFDYSVVIEWEIYSLNSSVIVMALILDWMSLIFMSFVLMISSLVMFYSNSYMEGDLFIDRFVILVFLFVLSMMFLILSPNLISILLGWDGLGLISYCLVIYYQNFSSSNAGLLTAYTNRVGDVFILLSIAWMLNFGSWNYIYYYDFFFNSYDCWLMCLMIMFAAMTSSAQIPFSSWLPAAMAAPTPVSALVHSSTLVTAGVYLLIRFSPMLMLSNMNYLLLFFGCLTMMMSGFTANYEFDLKSVIALSTLSQLGLMLSILSMGYPLLSFFHLLIHALFKSLLFLCAGCYIHKLSDYQDIRFMGSLTYSMPYVSACFNISNLSLCGFPFLSGFYSSDLILEFCSYNELNFLIYFMFFFSTGLTAMYSIRLFYYSLIGPNSFNVLCMFNNIGNDMYYGMMLLLLFTVFGGSLMFWLIFPIPSGVYLPLYLKLLTYIVVILGFYFGHLISTLSFNFFFKYFFLSDFIGYMWFLPLISTKLMSYGILMGSKLYYHLMDYGWLEYYGAQGLYNFFFYFVKQYLHLFDYNFKTYIMLFSLFFVLFYLYMLF